MPDKEKTGTVSDGEDGKLLSLVAYIFSWVTGLIVFVIAKNMVAKFHGMQSIILGLIGFLISWTVILFPISILLWIYGLYVGFVYGYQKGEIHKMPLIGDYAERYSA
jgi:uncharacterized membrane protein